MSAFASRPNRGRGGQGTSVLFLGRAPERVRHEPRHAANQPGAHGPSARATHPAAPASSARSLRAGNPAGAGPAPQSGQSLRGGVAGAEAEDGGAARGIARRRPSGARGGGGLLARHDPGALRTVLRWLAPAEEIGVIGATARVLHRQAQAAHRHVLHLDADMLIGGGSRTWVMEAAEQLAAREELVSCSPLSGPPRADGTIGVDARWYEPDGAPQAFRFRRFSSR